MSLTQLQQQRFCGANSRAAVREGFTSRQCLCLVEIREIGKELQLSGLKRCRETFHEETPRVTGMTSRSWPLAKTRRFSVAAAINKAICGTKADPVPQ